MSGKECLDVWLRVNNSVIAKDKLYRLVQYGSKLLAHHLSSMQSSFPLGKRALLVVRLRKLSAAISMCRKFYRIGKWIEQLKVAKGSLGNGNEYERVLCFTKALGLASWLFLDTLQWLHRSGIVLFSAYAGGIDTSASLCWIVSIVSSILLSGYRLGKELEVSKGNVTEKGVVKAAGEMVVSLCDLALPLGLLGIVRDEGVVGLCGVVSSYLSLKQLL